MTKVVADDLRRDADRWQEVAGWIAPLFEDDLAIEDWCFSGAGIRAGLPEAYRSVVETLRRLVPQGAAEGGDMAASLRQQANVYDAVDALQEMRYAELTGKVLRR
jgi:hypothetical protein